MREQSGRRVRDFGCGELHTVASAGCASVHYYVRSAGHPHRVEHAYPSHSLVFTDAGVWQYHGTEKLSTITDEIVVTGVGQREYSCVHPRGISNECFIVALADDAFSGEDAVVFRSATVALTPEMRAHRRAIVRAVQSIEDAELIEGLAFSLYEIAARASSRPTRIPPADVRMAYARKLLRDRCGERISIGVIARELDLSRFTFTRRFLSAEGITPHQYVMQLRIERAKDALLRTNLSIEDVGTANGFGSIAHFSHTFRAVVGCTPSAYRLMASSRADSKADG